MSIKRDSVGKTVPSDESPPKSKKVSFPKISGKEGSAIRPVFFLVIAMAVAGAVAPRFLTPGNLGALLVSSSFLVIVTVGESFVIMAGSIDLGVESVLSSFGMFAAWLTVLHSVPSVLAIIIVLVTSILFGLVVGLLVSKVHIPSFVVTLGSYWGMRGIALLIGGGGYISPSSVTPAKPFGFTGLASSPLGISNLVLIALVIVIISQLVISFTSYGVHLKALGSSQVAAARSGINVTWIKISVFAISACLAAFAGIMITAWQGSIYPLTAQGYSLEAIAAVILGGIPFSGGRGTIVGTAMGAILIGVINDVIVLVGLPSLYEYVFVAVVLVVAGLQARGSALVK